MGLSFLKFYEYLGHGKPVIASAGTLAAETVAACGAGWTPPYDAAELTGLLRRLLAAPDAVEEAVGRARQARAEHTWLRRVRTVVEDMRAMRAGVLSGLVSTKSRSCARTACTSA